MFTLGNEPNNAGLLAVDSALEVRWQTCLLAMTNNQTILSGPPDLLGWQQTIQADKHIIT